MATQINLLRLTLSALGLLASVFLVSLALSSHTGWQATYHKHELRSADDFFSKLVSPNTARAVAADEVFQRNLIDAVELTADLAKRLALHFNTVPELQKASENIETYRRSLTKGAKPKRQSLGDLLGLGGGTSSTNDTSSTSSDGGILSSLTGSLGSAFSGIGSSLLQDVGGAGFFLGTGLGAGAAQGLNLSTAAKTTEVASRVAADNGMEATGLNPMIQDAAMGATASLLGSVNVTSLLPNISNMDPHALAFGLATGLGNGTSAGLNLSPQSRFIQAPAGNSTQDIAGTFGFGLTKSLTSNLNLSSLTSGSSGLSSFTKNVDIARAAQGAAMGLVQGAGDAVNMMGGVQALINGTATMPTAPLPGPNMAFNDSVGGAATGFGQGLGGQGTLVGLQLLSQINVTSLLDGLTGNGTSSSSTQATPSNGTAAVVKRHSLHPLEIVRRQTQVSGGLNAANFNLSLIINAKSISSAAQTAINALSCEGVSGLVLVGLGLYSSGTINTKTISSLNTTFIKQALPKGIIHFTTGGNTFQIDGTTVADNIESNLLGAANGIVINGNTSIKFGTFLVLHILIALLVVATLIPAALSLEAIRNLLVRLKMNHVLPKLMRWVDIIWLFLISPLAILALIFGALTGGTAGHFRTVHGALGLATIMFTLVASASHLFAKKASPEPLRQAIVFPTAPFRFLHPLTIRTIIMQSLFALILPITFSGISDLSTMTLCVTRIIPLETGMGLGVGLSFLYIIASGLTGLTIWLSVRELRKKTKELKMGTDEEAWGRRTLKEKIQVVKKETL